MDNISIIIRNKNEGKHIGYAIQSCLDFFNNPEIIIIDNNSTDDSLEIVSMFRPILKEKLKIINISNYSPGASLNNTFISPHIANASIDSLDTQIKVFINNLVKYKNNQPLNNIIT